MLMHADYCKGGVVRRGGTREAHHCLQLVCYEGTLLSLLTQHLGFIVGGSRSKIDTSPITYNMRAFRPHVCSTVPLARVIELTPPGILSTLHPPLSHLSGPASVHVHSKACGGFAVSLLIQIQLDWARVM